ncbi:hypothetical protein [Helicobacter pylori]
MRQITESLSIEVKHQENISYKQATSFSKNLEKTMRFLKILP